VLDGCLKRVSIDEAPPDATPSPPAPRVLRSKSSPGGSQYSGAPVALAKVQPYSPVERPRDYTYYTRPRNRARVGSTSPRVEYVEELLEHADWSIPSEQGATLDPALSGSLLDELLLAAAAAPRNAPLSIQLESVAGQLAAASKGVAEQDDVRSSRRLAKLPPAAVPDALPPPRRRKNPRPRRSANAGLWR